MAERGPNKRAALIDALLARDEFAACWALQWCDLLRVKAEFPINLWPNAVQAYHRWLLEALRSNLPYDQFARALLTSSGSNFRVPPVNFYRALQGREPASIAAAVALTFMGARLDSWPAERRADMTTFFSRITYKPTAEWKEEIVCLNPAPADALPARLPDGTPVTIAPGTDPRRVFADWLIAPENPWFARNLVNRVWSWLLGRGIIHEPDDIRPDNPPANPELLAYLEREFVAGGYDLRRLFRLILTSRTYQQSSIPRSDDAAAAALTAFYPVRRLDAEVLVDALCAICGPGEAYSSAIPEPFTYIPDSQRSILLADGSITSPFLELFGRPARDTGLEAERNNRPTDGQLLHLLNSTHIQEKINRGTWLRELAQGTQGNARRMIRGIYVRILSREPTQPELTAAEKYVAAGKVNPKAAALDLVWALINTKEFLYRH
ncbi:MAG: DUF1553 domain-containing protein [Planctomycetes bacterium]|nr:DUF1553 domain-containing protein [Planctomycetota bacterium]